MEMTPGDSESRAPRPLRRRLVGTSLGGRTVAGEPSRPDADASDQRIVELWLRDRPPNTRVAYERDYGRFRAFIGARSLRTVGRKPRRDVRLRVSLRFVDRLGTG